MYHADTSRIGKSGLDLINKAPAKYWEGYLNPNKEKEKQTEALLVGSATHSILFEPDKFVNEYVVSPTFSGEGSKKARENFIRMNEGKKPISLEDYNMISRMRDSIMKHPLADELLSTGIAEQRLDWQDQITGALCKCKPDFRNTNNGLCIDLKTTEDASESAFTHSAWKYRYSVQSAFYEDGIRANMLPFNGFVFIAVEKEPPYLVNIFFADEDFVHLGREQYIEDLHKYMSCLQSGKWHGYSPEIKPLTPPHWALNK